MKISNMKSVFFISFIWFTFAGNLPAQESKKATSFDQSIHIDTAAIAANINTLEAFHATYFKGKKIFIDLWATWCLACRKEFAYKEQLDSLLKVHNINLVLLSLDSSTQKEQWVSYINKHKLKGYHFLINEELKKEIISIAGYSKSLLKMPLPYYIYMDEQGEFIDNNAPRPSEIGKLADLFEQE